MLPLENSRWRAAHERLLDLLWRFSDRVEPDPDPAGAISAAYYLDFGSLRLADTLQLCRQLQAEVQGELGLTGRVGLAGSKFPARVAALTSSEPVGEVPAGTEGDFLASLPVRLLALDAEQAHRLALLGIHTLGQLAALPRSAMLAQLGPNGPLLHDLASGIDPRPLVPQRQPRQVTVFHEFEPPVEDRQILLATLEHLAGQLVEQPDGQPRSDPVSAADPVSGRRPDPGRSAPAAPAGVHRGSPPEAAGGPVQEADAG